MVFQTYVGLEWRGEAVRGTHLQVPKELLGWMESGKSGMIPNNGCGCSTRKGCAEKFKDLEGGDWGNRRRFI